VTKKSSPSKRSAAKLPPGRKSTKAGTADLNQSTTDEFERENMGIAPKE
jgi:hypothetical protein